MTLRNYAVSDTPGTMRRMGRSVAAPRRLHALGLLLALAACSERPGARTSVVLIVADTLRGDVFLSPVWESSTPHLDRLAEDGIFFPHCYSHAPLTLPSHVALFSSRHPHENGTLVNGQPINSDLPLLAEWLAEHGYETRAAVSIATLWPPALDAGIDRGFHRFALAPEEVAPGPSLNAQLLPLLDGLNPDQPFFLLAHYSDPHQPWNAHGTETRFARLLLDGEEIKRLSTSDATWWSDDWVLEPGHHELTVVSEDVFRLRRIRLTGPNPNEHLIDEIDLTPTTERRYSFRVPPFADEGGRYRIDLWIHDVPTPEEVRVRYYGEVHALDNAVGELLRALKERHLYEDTLILFTSDHGEGLGEHGTIGHVKHLHRELLHVPLLIKLPADCGELATLVEAARGLVPQIDLVPTILDLLGLPPLPGATGRSLMEGGNRILLAETHRPEAPRDLVSMRDLSCLVVFDPETDGFQVFDLEADPEEVNDLGSEGLVLRPEWAKQLRRAAQSAKDQSNDFGVLDREAEARLRVLGY
jgi:membrane-anchored protein YejM (alkaline phosphatase superfamily)